MVEEGRSSPHINGEQIPATDSFVKNRGDPSEIVRVVADGIAQFGR